MAYFELNDVRGLEYDDWSRPEHIETRTRIQPYERITKIALSVLAKSAAAALIRFKRIPLPETWRILVVPFFGEEPESVFAAMPMEHLKIEDGVDLWIGKTDKESWTTAYRYENLVAFFLFDIHRREADKFARLQCFREANVLYYEGKNLLGLAGHRWPEYPRGRKPRFPVAQAGTIHLGRWMRGGQ